jgi:hypothetical protein
MSEDMISIEDTYKEMGLSSKLFNTADEKERKEDPRDKSMTIIEEEELEES